MVLGSWARRGASLAGFGGAGLERRVREWLGGSEVSGIGIGSSELDWTLGGRVHASERAPLAGAGPPTGPAAAPPAARGLPPLPSPALCWRSALFDKNLRSRPRIALLTRRAHAAPQERRVRRRP